MKEFVCIECPKGCRLTIDDDLNVTGNTCPRGKTYAINEVTCPKRIVTSLIKTKNMIYPCKTSGEVPKEKVFDCLNEIGKIKLKSAKRL